MADLTLPIVGLTALAGYFFNKDSTRQQRKPLRKNIEQFDKPNGDNIYTSNMYDQVNKEILDRSLKRYKEAENPAESGILPPLFNTYGVVGNPQAINADYNFKEVYDNNKLKNVVVSQSPTIETRPMFNNLLSIRGNNDNQNDETVFVVNPVQEASLLTGEPLERGHNNMTPFFGSHVRQNIEKFVNEPLLDHHTGRNSVFQHKQEVPKMFSDQPENIYGAPLFTNAINTERYIPSLYRQNEKPVEDVKIRAPKAGTFENTIRPTFKDVNALRPGNKPKDSYEGRTVTGQLGDVRGVHGRVEKHRPDTYYEQSNDQWLTAPGEFKGPKLSENFSTNFKGTAREEYTQEYFGTRDAKVPTQSQRYTNSNGSFDALVQDPKRQNFENDYHRNVGGLKQTSDYGKNAIKAYETERGEQGVLSNAHNSGLGNKVRPIDEIKATMKETVLSEQFGNIKTTFDYGNASAYNSGMATVIARPTHKESTMTEDYQGLPKTGEGLGYITNKYEARATGKEIITNNSAYSGNVNKNLQNTSRDNYDNAEIRDFKETLVKGERPSGPQKFQIASGVASYANPKVTENMFVREHSNKGEYMYLDGQKSFPDKAHVGTSHKLNDDATNTATTNNRFDPSIIKTQFDNNPYSIYGDKKI